MDGLLLLVEILWYVTCALDGEARGHAYRDGQWQYNYHHLEIG